MLAVGTERHTVETSFCSNSLHDEGGEVIKVTTVGELKSSSDSHLCVVTDMGGTRSSR